MTDTREADPRPTTPPSGYMLVLVITAAFYLAVGIIIGWWFL